MAEWTCIHSFKSKYRSGQLLTCKTVMLNNTCNIAWWKAWMSLEVDVENDQMGYYIVIPGAQGGVVLDLDNGLDKSLHCIHGWPVK